MNQERIAELLENTRRNKPLVHCITNYVTVNDVANMVLACGASPIMADDPGEAADITKICQATVINIGTLTVSTVEAMCSAGKAANELCHPVVLDPVGAGASPFRTQTLKKLLDTVHFTVIKGNISEIKTLAQGTKTGKGVDAAVTDSVTAENIAESAVFVKQLAEKTGAVIAVTGATDIIADATEVYVCRNGSARMSAITGCGCMLSALAAAFCGANPSCPLEAVTAAVSAMGVCGEIAQRKTRASGGGTGTFRTQLIDTMSLLTGEILKGACRLEKI
jgi:hydroxyethylthiazole kinase